MWIKPPKEYEEALAHSLIRHALSYLEHMNHPQKTVINYGVGENQLLKIVLEVVETNEFPEPHLSSTFFEDSPLDPQAPANS